MLNAAACTIVSELSNDHFDSYVLSESSLFVYPLKIIFKTCGTTQLLKAIPKLLDASSKLFFKVCRCKYTRGTFLFPEAQPYPYGNFDGEVALLEKYFGKLGLKGMAYVMGDVEKTQNWHIYVAATSEVPRKDTPVYTVEMCMTQLDRKAASTFYKTSGHETASEMTYISGIRNFLPNSKICEFAFDPCGYSMNSIEGSAHSTIHVTPEEGFSYASFEAMGYSPDMIDLDVLVDRVTSCFKPACFSLSIYVCGGGGWESGTETWDAIICPYGYACIGTSRQELPGGSAVVYHTFKEANGCGSPVKPLSLATFEINSRSYQDICSMKLNKSKKGMGLVQFQITGM
ncbi:hypothetical protein O6H91_06G066100 [Diphasiastrum complanatum]|nr:hypothetical protein O6H91_06G066100 [Diphasiastrum complanatum]